MNTDNKKINIGVFFGGKSPEHDISITTGQFTIVGLKKLDYSVTPIYLDKQGKWYIDEKLGSLETFLDPEKKEDYLCALTPYSFDLNSSVASQKIIFQKQGLMRKTVTIDIAFPTFHGLNGEDGTIQGLFELLNVPYIGCGVASSALTMDKIFTKLIYQSKDILTPDFLSFNSFDWGKNEDTILQKITESLKWPIFVKPARLGSSIGITKTQNYEELKMACELGFHYDERIIVEEAVENLMDLTCCVIGNEHTQTSLVQETSFTEGLLSYEDKYLKDGGTQTGQAQNSIIIPARIDEETTNKIREMSAQIFKLFDCSGIARVDFLYNKQTRQLYANEVNTLPGTLYHHLWEKSNLKFEELLEKLINWAQKKHQTKNKVTYSFDSNLLQTAKAIKLQLNNSSNVGRDVHQRLNALSRSKDPK